MTQLKRTLPDDELDSDLPELHMNRRTKVCLWIIILGLSNFLVYAIMYMFIGGEAVSGKVQIIHGHKHYLLQSGQEVDKAAFIYSGIHSISVWLTVAAVMLAMLTLAKDRIISSMHSTVVRGRTFITVLATVITFSTVVLMIWFILQFAHRLNNPEVVRLATQAVGG